MKPYSAQTLAGLASGEVLASSAVYLAAPSPLRAWGGFGSLVLDGETFFGVGNAGLVRGMSASLGAVAQGTEMELSGIDPDIIPVLNLPDLRGVSAAVWLLLFNGTGSALLDARVWQRGRVDVAYSEETPGGTSKIIVKLEGSARGLGRRSERMRSDADQRLISPTDGGLSRVSYAGEKTIYAGGKMPQRAASMLGASPDADLLNRMKR